MTLTYLANGAAGAAVLVLIAFALSRFITDLAGRDLLVGFLWIVGL